MGLPRQEHWSGSPGPLPGDLPDPGMKPTSPALAGGFFTTETPGEQQMWGVLKSRKDSHGKTAALTN